jgi:hypothetical protein
MVPHVCGIKRQCDMDKLEMVFIGRLQEIKKSVPFRKDYQVIRALIF